MVNSDSGVNRAVLMGFVLLVVVLSGLVYTSRQKGLESVKQPSNGSSELTPKEWERRMIEGVKQK